jgi:hypothetical protein
MPVTNEERMRYNCGVGKSATAAATVPTVRGGLYPREYAEGLRSLRLAYLERLEENGLEWAPWAEAHFALAVSALQTAQHHFELAALEMAKARGGGR